MRTNKPIAAAVATTVVTTKDRALPRGLSRRSLTTEL
jgi:hypothetical protein